MQFVKAASMYIGRDENRQNRRDRRNRDRNTNPVSGFRVFTGQASRQDTLNYVLGSHSNANRRTNRHRNNQHEEVDDYSTTAEFGDTMDQNVLDNFNSLTINDDENNSVATHNPGDYIHNAEITQNVPRGQQGRRTRQRNNRNNNNELAQASNPTHPGINNFKYVTITLNPS
uniref:Uncharacterized protein n=1 Tax=Meloidogyne javanica TaxID=6303 RepID=A0A915M7M3_MELJA